MHNYDKLQTNYDRLIKSLEDMIVARDEMHEEDKYSNYREVLKIRQEIYEPAKKRVKEDLEEVIKEVVRQMFQNRTKHNL